MAISRGNTPVASRGVETNRDNSFPPSAVRDMMMLSNGSRAGSPMRGMSPLRQEMGHEGGEERVSIVDGGRMKANTTMARSMDKAKNISKGQVKKGKLLGGLKRPPYVTEDDRRERLKVLALADARKKTSATTTRTTRSKTGKLPPAIKRLGDDDAPAAPKTTKPQTTNIHRPTSKKPTGIKKTAFASTTVIMTKAEIDTIIKKVPNGALIREIWEDSQKPGYSRCGYNDIMKREESNR